MPRRLVWLVALLVMACGGSKRAAPPQAVVEQAVAHLVRGEDVAFARLLAADVRGAAESDYQLEKLTEWLRLRAIGTDLEGATLDGVDAPKADVTGSTATVRTVARCTLATATPPERPVPLRISLRLEGNAWKITDAVMDPLPAWYRTAHEEPPFPGEPPPPPPRAPAGLAELASHFRAPPPQRPSE
jgi:hypothetical protein